MILAVRVLKRDRTNDHPYPVSDSWNCRRGCDVKLGQKLKDPFSDECGEVVSIDAKGVAICRTESGRIFRGGVRAAGRKRKPVIRLVRVVDGGDVLSDWIEAQPVGRRFRITGQHPVFAGCVMDRRDLEIES